MRRMEAKDPKALASQDKKDRWVELAYHWERRFRLIGFLIEKKIRRGSE